MDYGEEESGERGVQAWFKVVVLVADSATQFLTQILISVSFRR